MVFRARNRCCRVALFCKDVDSLRADAARSASVHRQSATVSTTASRSRPAAPTPGCSPAAIWDFNTPATTEGGPVKGFEISYQQPFTFLPGVLEQLRHHPQLHGCRIRDHLPDRVGRGRCARPIITAVTDDLTGLSKRRLQRHAVLRQQDLQCARVRRPTVPDYLTTVPGRNSNDVEGTAETLNIDFSTLVQHQRSLLRLARGAEPHR